MLGASIRLGVGPVPLRVIALVVLSRWRRRAQSSIGRFKRWRGAAALAVVAYAGLDRFAVAVHGDRGGYQEDAEAPGEALQNVGGCGAAQDERSDG